MVVSKAAGEAAIPPLEMSDDSSVNELSRLLLQGWTMLAETCPRPNCHMPLARSRSGRVVCTHCHADVVSNIPEPAVPATTPPVPPAANATNAPREGLTAALGQKLLQGWTLMDDACTTCATPLVRDANRRIVCVACEEGEETGEGDGRALNSQERRIANNHERRVVSSDQRRLVNRDNGHAEQGGQEPIAERRVEPVVNNERRVERVERRVEPVGERRVEHVGERRIERVERRVGDHRESSAGPEGRHTTTVARVDQHVEFDVDDELLLCEEAAARQLRGLRTRLSRVEDAEACRVVCSAMTEACNVIRASRQARGLPRGA